MGNWWDQPVGTRAAGEATAAPEANYNDSDQVAVVYPNGTAGVIPRSKLHEEVVAHGARLEAPGATEARAEGKEQEGRGAQTFIERAASVGTFGGSDLLARALNPDVAHKMRVREEANPGAGFAGELAGAFTGAGALAGGVGHLAEAGAAKALGGGLLGRVGAAGIGSAAEGGLFGAGAGISQLALDDKPITWEGAASTIGSNVLGGAAIGGGIGVGGKLLAEGATAAGAYANKQVEALTKPEAAVDRGVYPEIADMDQKATSRAIGEEVEAGKARKATDIAETRAAQKAEESRLVQTQTEQARGLYDEAQAYKAEVLKSENFIPTPKGEMRGHVRSATSKITKGLDNADGFVESLGEGKFHTGLQEQATFLERTLAKSQGIDPAAEQQSFLDALPKGEREPLSPATTSDIPKGWRPFSLEEDGVHPQQTVQRGLPGYEDVNPARTLNERGRPNPRAPDKLYIVKLSDLEEAGLYSDKLPRNVQSQIDNMAGHFDAEGGWSGDKPLPPVELWMASDGTLHTYEGNHRLSAALRAGTDRDIPALIRPMPEAYGGARPAESIWPLPGHVEGKAYLSAEQADAYARWRGEPLPGKAMDITKSDLQAFKEAARAGGVLPPSLQRLETARTLLEKNRALQARFAEVQAKPTSKLLDELGTKLDQIKADTAPAPREQALRAHGEDLREPKSLGRSIAQGAGGLLGGNIGMAVGGPMFAMAGAFIGRDAGAQIFDKLARKLVNGNAARGKAIKVAVARMFEGGANKVARAMPEATKIIPAIQYASKKDADATLGPDNAKASKDALVSEFRQRKRELDSVTEPTAQVGVYQARMQAMGAMHDRLGGLWAIAPAVANGVEKLQAAKWAYLASKVPRNPAPPTLQIGPDNWEPSKTQIAQFARIMQSAEHPEVVAQHLADGTATPADVDVLKTLYPGHYEEIRQQCMDHASTLQRTLPYVQRLNLSILLDVDVDPGLTSTALSVYQAPKPSPQQAQPPQPIKGLPTGMVEPTQAQRMSSK